MASGVFIIAFVVFFVTGAFVLKARMQRLAAIYETRTKVLLAAEVTQEQIDAAALEREIVRASQNSRVMRRHEELFRLLWPQEYDRAFYGAQRFIAQSSRTIALKSR